MDAGRFDALCRTLTIAGSRRRTLGAALAGALAVLSQATPNAAIAGACKRKPGECEKCTRTKRKRGKKKSGKIKAKADGTPCSVGSCQSGRCVAATSAPPSGCPARRVCGATCCPEGQVCGTNGACLHETCCSGDATCGPHTTAERLCCAPPRQAFCCCDTAPGTGNGYAICCSGSECQTNCNTGSATGGLAGSPDADGVCPLGGNAATTC